MPNAAVGAGTVAPGKPASSGMGGNPFQVATNLYAEKNLQGQQTSLLLTTSAINGGGSVNAGQYLRALRLMLRTVTPAPAGGSAFNIDAPFSLFTQLDLTNVDGSEILYNMGGFAYYVAQKYFRPWQVDPARAYDFTVPAAALGGSCTLTLMPEIRFTAGVLANTDTRSQYRFDYALNGAQLGTFTTMPTIALIPYMDAWAQPDAQDLQGTPNQPVPPGVNLQVKRRHQIFTMNGNGSDNTLLSTLTGNAIRGMILVTRDNTGVRQDGFSDPIYWQLDNRSLGRLNPDIIRLWAENFYASWPLYGISNQVALPFGGAYVNNNASDNLFQPGPYQGPGGEDRGVYVFPRFMNPGDLMGQGWLYTANSTKLYWESATANSAATCELITDEVYPVGAVDPMLVDI